MPNGSRANKTHSLRRIDKSEGEHASQARQHVDVPSSIGGEQHLGIRSGRELLSEPRQLLAQLNVIIDLAVENDNEVAAPHRLVGTLIEVDDGEPRMAEIDRTIRDNELHGRVRVGTAVSHQGHRRCGASGCLGVAGSADVEPDPAHSVNQPFARM